VEFIIHYKNYYLARYSKRIIEDRQGGKFGSKVQFMIRFGKVGNGQEH
jgi:hypothetical protein